MKRYDTDFLLSRKNFVLTIPIEVERDQIYLPVTIGGRQYRFKLDTGASQGVIYDDVDMPGLKELGFIKSEDATGMSREPPITPHPTHATLMSLMSFIFFLPCFFMPHGTQSTERHENNERQ